MRDRSNWLSSVFRNPLSGLEPSWRKALQSPAVSVLIALLVAQFVAALVLAGNATRSTATDAPLLDLSADQVTRIEISGPDEQVVIARAADGWVLPALANFPADTNKVDQLLSTLTTLERTLPVGSSSDAQRRLKVSDDNAQRRIRLSGNAGELAQILTGDSPGFRHLYARLAGEAAVYDLPLASFQLASASDEWVRRDQLRLDAEAIERISSDDWTLSRIDGNWQLDMKPDRSAGPTSSAPASEQAEAELDRAEVEALVSRIADLSYQGVQMAATGTDSSSDAQLGLAGDDADATAGESAGVKTKTGLAVGDTDSTARADARTSAGVSGESDPTTSPSAPLLRLDIQLENGGSLSRRIFADGNGSYLLQTDEAPQLYELSEYDLDGVLGLNPEQLIANGANQPTEATEEVSSADKIAKDGAAEISAGSDLGAVPALEADASQFGEPGAAASTAPATVPSAAAPRAGPSSTPAAKPTAGLPTTRSGGLPSDLNAEAGGALENATGDSTTPAAGAKDGGQPTRADAPGNGDTAAAGGRASDEAAPSSRDASTEPPAEQTDFRPQEPRTRRPAPRQWPYQRYVPPSRQPWPPQGPPQGAPPQSAPGWR